MFLQTLIQALSEVPPWLATIIMAMLPVAELRGALPVAITVYKLPLFEAILLSILGNMLPVYFLLVFFERVSTHLSQRSDFAKRFFDNIFERTRLKLEAHVEKYGPWALALFVSVPLPVTGAWTGALAAFVFGLPKKKAFLAILVGVCVASAVVTILTLGATSTIRLLF